MLLILQEPKTNLQESFQWVWDKTITVPLEDNEAGVKVMEQFHNCGALYVVAQVGKCQTMEEVKREMEKVIAQVFNAVPPAKVPN